MTSGLAWLNDLMLWLARWIPRITLIKATHAGVLFGPNGRVRRIEPGLLVYWPITHALTVVSTRIRTAEIAAQLHGREAVQIVISWRIDNPVAALMTLNDPAANLDDRAQAALAHAYSADWSSADIASGVSHRLRSELEPSGVVVEGVDVSQRGPIRAIRLMSDWGTHESRVL